MKAKLINYQIIDAATSDLETAILMSKEDQVLANEFDISFRNRKLAYSILNITI